LTIFTGGLDKGEKLLKTAFFNRFIMDKYLKKVYFINNKINMNNCLSFFPELFHMNFISRYLAIYP